MRAAVRTKYGPPEVVSVQEVQKPTVTPDGLLVRVHASSVNRTDAHTRAGTPTWARPVTGFPKPRASILGCEFAGTVAEVGSAVTTFAVGDRVFGYNEGPFGCHAEYLALAHDASVAAIPDHITFDRAAVATEGAHYAYMQTRRARIQSGQRVLVNGGTGAIGSALVQLAKADGAIVTATCAGEHADLVRDLGADHIIDYTTTDFTTIDERFDVVSDAVGKSSFRACRHLLGPEGQFFSAELGPWGQNAWYAIAGRFTGPPKAQFPLPFHNQKMMEKFGGLMASGQFRPLIDRRYPLAQIVDAYRYVETGQKLGNVIIGLDDTA